MITLSMLLDLGHRLWLLAYTEPDLLPGVTGAEAGRSPRPDLGAGTGLLPYGEEWVISLLPGELWVDELRLCWDLDMDLMGEMASDCCDWESILLGGKGSGLTNS